MEVPTRPVRRSRVWRTVTVVTIGLTFVLLTTGARGLTAILGPALVAAAALATAVWAVWRLRADRAEHEAKLTQWAAAEAVLAERLWIARDLHDIVSHGLGLITVRAAATRHLPKSPEVEAALGDIEETGRRATAELRRMLGVLRSSDVAGPRAPVEGLRELDGIIAAAQLAGVRVRLERQELGEVSQGVQTALCKTVREALGNVARHAGPADARISLHRIGNDVIVSIVDDGPSAGWMPAPGAGHGLIGLRERITSLGGDLRTEPAGNGFAVTARLPDGQP